MKSIHVYPMVNEVSPGHSITNLNNALLLREIPLALFDFPKMGILMFPTEEFQLSLQLSSEKRAWSLGVGHIMSPLLGGSSHLVPG